jgi:hypothetical protein
MRGVSIRSRLNVSNRETSLKRVVDEVNRLPFAYVGFAMSRTADFAIPAPNTPTPLALIDELHDPDEMVNGAGTGATIPEGLDGYYVIEAGLRSSGGGTVVFQVLRGTEVVLHHLVTGVDSHVRTPPVFLSAGDVLSWRVQAASASFGIVGRVNTSSTTFPYVSIHRVGLLP